MRYIVSKAAAEFGVRELAPALESGSKLPHSIEPERGARPAASCHQRQGCAYGSRRRTRRDPKIELEAKHTYPTPGKYAMVVKAIDILGNDTTTTVEVEVR